MMTREDAARVLGLATNAPKVLIEEAYWSLLNETKGLAPLARDQRIVELGDAYSFLCQHYVPADTELRGPRSCETVSARRHEPVRFEPHELLAVDAGASPALIRLALNIQLGRVGRGIMHEELREEIRNAGATLLSHASSNGYQGGLESEPAEPTKLTTALSPELSAARVTTTPQIVAGLLLVTSLIAGLAVSPSYTLIALVAVITVMYIGAMGYKALLLVRSVSAACETPVLDADVASLRNEDLPIYTLLVPLYHEANIVEHLVRALDKLDYPRDRLDVKLLLEADDDETRSVAEGLDLPSHVQVLVVPPTDEPQGKPRACNYGLQHARGEYVVLYDAEDIPDPLQLKKALLAFRQAQTRVGCVQAKLMYFNANQNLITRWFTVEYSTWFDLYLPGLNSIAAPIPLGGTSNHFPADVLKRVGGWDAYNVTEDADLGTRLAREGFRTLLIDSWTLEEANSRLGNWLRQRSRWVKGYMQTWLVHMRNPLALSRELGWRGFAAFQVMILGTFFVYFVNPVFWVLIAVWYSTRASFVQHLYPAPVLYLATLSLFAGNFFFLVVGMVSVLKRGYFEGVKYVLASYVYWALMSVAAWKALYQLVARPHYWEKTRHGFARAHLTEIVEEAD